MQFILVIWAAFGLKHILEITKENVKKVQNIIFGIGGTLILIGLIVLIFGSSFPLEKASDASQFDPQVLDMIKQVRLEMLQTDALRMILFAVLTGLLCFLFFN